MVIVAGRIVQAHIASVNLRVLLHAMHGKLETVARYAFVHICRGVGAPYPSVYIYTLNTW